MFNPYYDYKELGLYMLEFDLPSGDNNRCYKVCFWSTADGKLYAQDYASATRPFNYYESNGDRESVLRLLHPVIDRHHAMLILERYDDIPSREERRRRLSAWLDLHISDKYDYSVRVGFSDA